MNSPGTPYDESFYARIGESSLRSASRVMPIVFEYLGAPESVVDVGCGTGTWLSVCTELGARRILGLDGSYVERSSLVIPPDCFRPTDLTKPPSLNDSFDLAISMEVAEHLPPQSARSFVSFLTSLSEAILFSAAVPGQGGVNHTNEQWPRYWAALFAEHGYAQLDPIRPAIWQDALVERFYAQNTFLYTSARLTLSNSRFLAEAERHRNSRLTILYDNLAWGNRTVPQALRILRGALGRAVRHRLRFMRP